MSNLVESVSDRIFTPDAKQLAGRVYDSLEAFGADYERFIPSSWMDLDTSVLKRRWPAGGSVYSYVVLGEIDSPKYSMRFLSANDLRIMFKVHSPDRFQRAVELISKPREFYFRGTIGRYQEPLFTRLPLQRRVEAAFLMLETAKDNVINFLQSRSLMASISQIQEDME